MVQWRFQDGDRTVLATIDISDEGDEMLLDFSKEHFRNGTRELPLRQFSAWYRPGTDTIDLILDDASDAENQFEEFLTGFRAENLVEMS